MNVDSSEQIYNGSSPEQIEDRIDPSSTQDSILTNTETDHNPSLIESHREDAGHVDSSSDASTVEEEPYDSTGSLASTGDEDEPENPPERIIWEDHRHGQPCYLVKWQGYSLIRSTWETEDSLREYPRLLSTWESERQKISEGKSDGFDLAAYTNARKHLWQLEKERRRLRRLKRAVKSVLAAAKAADDCFVLATIPSPPSPSSSPRGDTELICPGDNLSECYPKQFQPTEEFQLIREGQDIPPGLHVRLNIWTGEKEARLNIPIEGEDVESNIPVEQAMVVVPESEQEATDQKIEEKPAVRGQEPPEYNPAGKILPPRPDDTELETFQKAMLFVNTEGHDFDTALDDLSDLSHDIYYGVEIVKDGPVLERLICLLASQSPGHEVEGKKGRDHKAASILSSAIQNNPTALKELTKMQKLVLYPTCDAEKLGGAKPGDNIIKLLHSQLSSEHSPAALRAKVSALSGFLKDPSIRDNFITNEGMKLLLSMFLKGTDYKWSSVKERIANLVTDNFLDEEMGAVLGIWPKLPISSDKVCEKSNTRTSDGCWEYHVKRFVASAKKNEADEDWATEFLNALQRQRPQRKIGASLLASKDVEQGEAIIKINNPFISVVEKSALDRICAYCFKEGKESGLKRCSGCKTDRYCSQSCQVASWKAFHKKECPIFKGLPGVLPTPVRALLQVLLQHRAISEEPRWPQLKSHMVEQQNDRERAMEMMLQCKAAMKYANFPEKSANIAVEILARMRVNAFRITLPDDTPVGLCFEPRASLANHSCTPNVAITFDGRALCMRAIEHIKKDEEVFISYVDPTQRREMRQNELRDRYFFTCECEKCVRDMSPYQIFQRFVSDGSQKVDLLYRLDQSKAFASSQVAKEASISFTEELKSQPNIFTQAESILQKSKDESITSKFRYLKKAHSLLSPLTTHGRYAQAPYPSFLHAFYLAYLDTEAYLPATVVLIFLHLKCDIYNYPQPHNPVRVIRLFTIAQLLKVIASMSTEDLQSTCKQFLSKDKENIEMVLGIDYISTVQALLILVTELVEKSHGPGTRIAVEIRTELEDVEEVQRLRGGYGEYLKLWQISNGADIQGREQAKICFAALRELAELMPLLLETI
ncbi:hypothetical protein B7463_g1965, partial [Scytalidium lignicola]